MSDITSLPGVLVTNVHSLLSRRDNLGVYALDHTPYVIVLSEIWFLISVADSVISFPGNSLLL